MPNRLEVGQISGSEKRFHLPPDVAVQATAILGIRGSGKTVTASVLVEEVSDLGVQVVVIDPVDVWWGLKSSADGDEEGYPFVVFGGHHADLPLEREMGAQLADVAVDQRVPMILSLRHLRKSKQKSFVTAFAEQLYHRKGEAEHRRPLLVAIDEASSFIPQRVGGAEARMVGAIEDLVRRGRASGLGVVLIDQRAASVNKDVLTQCEVLVSHQLTAPQDQKAVDAWIKQHDTEGRRDAFLEGLAGLPRGTAWFWSPRLDVFERVDVRMRRTFDSSSTPELGKEPALPEKLATADLEDLRSKLASAIEEAEKNDPAALRARIGDLEAELEKATAARDESASAGESDEIAELLERIEQLEAELAHAHEASAEAGLDAAEDERARWERWAEERTSEMEAWRARLQDAVTDAIGALPDLNAGRPSEGAPASRERSTRRSAEPAAATPRTGARRTPASAGANGAPPADANGHDLTSYQRDLLQTLRELEALGVDSAARETLAAFAGYSHRSSAFTAHLASLRDDGFIVYPVAGEAQLTAAGRRHTRRPERRPTLDQLHEGWLKILSTYESALLRELLETHPRALTREALAERAGYSASSSAFTAAVAQLQKLGAAEYPEPGCVRAGAVLYPEGIS